MIKKVIRLFGVSYFCCLTSTYASPIFLKKEGDQIERINFKTWEKVNTQKALNLKKLQSHIHSDVIQFLQQLMPNLKTHAGQKERRIRYRRVA